MSDSNRSKKVMAPIGTGRGKGKGNGTGSGSANASASTRFDHMAASTSAASMDGAWGGADGAWGGADAAWGGADAAWGGADAAWGGADAAWGGGAGAWVGAAGFDVPDDDDQFFDASDDFSGFEMDLESALDEAKLAINYFFNNKFDEARKLLAPYADTSMYHAMGCAVFAFLEAILTFEQRHIQTAGEELRKCLNVCSRFRRKTTITQSLTRKFYKSKYGHLNDVEAHAELCTAEMLLLKALLTFIEDETLGSLIRGALKIRQCFMCYKECAQILQQRRWSSETSKLHFESGVRMGLGTFNLFVSMLPSCVIKVLEFIGFSGNKAAGLADLHIGYELQGLRQVLCSMTLLGYHLIVCYVLSHQEGDLKLCDNILNVQLQLYPNGVWFLFFKGRLEFMRGNLTEASRWYKKSWKSQDVWPQFHHLAYWELLWVNCLQQNWRDASLYASYLVERSNWSRTIYSYQQAAIMLMIDDRTGEDTATIKRLLQDVPAYKQRIAGKSLPMEKFVCKKATRYFAQGQHLVLPAIELMFLWNTFKQLGKRYELAASVYRLVDAQLKEFKELAEKRARRLSAYAKAAALNGAAAAPTMDNGACAGAGTAAAAGAAAAAAAVDDDDDAYFYLYDNLALCLLLRGACLRQMHKPTMAIKDLKACVDLRQLVKEDTYLMPYAQVEVALIYADDENYDRAIATLEDAKKRYTGFSLESRLHFRVHTALMDLREANAANGVGHEHDL